MNIPRIPMIERVHIIYGLTPKSDANYGTLRTCLYRDIRSTVAGLLQREIVVEAVVKYISRLVN